MLILQRFATLNAKQVVQNLGLWKISSRGHCGHSPQFASQEAVQHPVTKEMRLGCPAYVCGGGSGGSYTFGLEQ